MIINRVKIVTLINRNIGNYNSLKSFSFIHSYDKLFKNKHQIIQLNQFNLFCVK